MGKQEWRKTKKNPPESDAPTGGIHKIKNPEEEAHHFSGRVENRHVLEDRGAVVRDDNFARSRKDLHTQKKTRERSAPFARVSQSTPRTLLVKRAGACEVGGENS
jgi:hypothetical protein